MKSLLAGLAALIALLSPLRADSIDEVIADLRSGDPMKLHERLRVIPVNGLDARFMEPLWALVVAEERVATIPDNTVRGFHQVNLRRLARERLAVCKGDLAGLALQQVALADPVARREAAELLSRLEKPVPGTVSALDRGLRDDYPAMRMASIAALGKQGEPAVAPLMKHLKKVAAEPDFDELYAVAKALGGMGSEARKILPDLTAYLDLGRYSSSVVTAVLTGVGPLGRAAEWPMRNWDLVLPSLKRLEQQSRGKDDYPGRFLADEIAADIAAGKKVLGKEQE